MKLYWITADYIIDGETNRLFTQTGLKSMEECKHQLELWQKDFAITKARVLITEDGDPIEKKNIYPLQEEIMLPWNIVAEDGNPRKTGSYLCIVIHDDYWNGEKTGKVFAEVKVKYYVDYEEEFALETGDYASEWVYAWRYLQAYRTIELPDGVVWDEE